LEEPMKVVILCGGRGTRFREETEHRPKPMIEVGGRPILWHIMKHFARYGHTDFVLCLGYKGALIKQYFLDYEAMSSDFRITLGKTGGIELGGTHAEDGWRVTLADTGLDTLTGGRVKRIQRYVGDEPFMLTYGDGLSNVDLDALVAFHRESGLVGTVTGVAPPGRFGELAIDGDRVASFTEKPAVSGGFINGGFFVFEPGFFDYLSPDEACILEREPLERLAADGQLGVHRHHGFWQCIDTFRDYTLVSDLWSSGEAPWKTWD
jgi:glucose-1-phosphate cytidylyltransferase